MHRLRSDALRIIKTPWVLLLLLLFAGCAADRGRMAGADKDEPQPDRYPAQYD